MKGGDTFEERAVSFAQPTSHYTLVLSVDGRFLACDEHGATYVTETISDDLMWRLRGELLEHVQSSVVLNLDAVDVGHYELTLDGMPLDADGQRGAVASPYAIEHGPERLPSEYLAHLTKNGWVCLASILSSEIVDGLQRIACTDGYSERSPDRSRRQICQSSALAKTADYPYHWGINAAGKVPTPSGKTVMGVQRIVCVSEFTKYRGATAFKLGSHALDHGPPEEWGVARDAYQPGHRAVNGLPYNGPDADVIEAPPGSMILFDTRTWHRAGINRSDQNRAAILMDMTPAYIVPYSDTTGDYRALVESEVYDELNRSERSEFQRLMIHRFLGPAGPQSVIGTDQELTERIPLREKTSY